MRQVAAIAAVLVFAAVAHGRPRTGEPPVLSERSSRTSLNSLNSLNSIASGDTIWYGGTTWMPDSMRWEAIRDSVWTFDTGVGSSITGDGSKPSGYHYRMEGWTSEDLQAGGLFRRSQVCAISGSYSCRAGLSEAEAESACYATGQGYGNGWGASLQKVFSFTSSSSVTLRFDYGIDSEPGFDYGSVSVDTSGFRTPGWFLWSVSGNESGQASVELTQASGTLPSSSGVIRIIFYAFSDPSYSDEDGLFPTTCGLLSIDNIELSGGITDFTDFENGMNGWTDRDPARGYACEMHTPRAVGDYAHLAHLDDLPKPGSFTGCGLQDSVLLFVNQDNTYFMYQENVAISPWTDLQRQGDTGRPGRLVSLDMYSNLAYFPGPYANVFLWIGMRWYPEPCPYSGPDQTGHIAYSFVPTGIQCSEPSRFIKDFSSVVPSYAQRVQILVGLQGCLAGFDCSMNDSTTAWIDNIRFGVYGTPVGVPETPEPVVTRLEAATPNPFRTLTSIAFTLERSAPVTLTILDVAGRLVRTIVDADYSEGIHSAVWDGLDDLGHPVTNGLYFYCLTAAGHSEGRKVMVMR